jgi:DNA-binding SARP family transcriptional activator
VLGTLQLLDRFRLEWRDQTRPLAHGSERLLALLALTPEGARRRQVARMLWPDLRAERIPGSLRTLLWRIRQECPGLLETEGERVRVRDGVDIDVRRLQELAAQWRAQSSRGRPTAREFAIAELDALVAPSTLLPGWYDDWVLLHRERLSALRVELLTHAARARLGAGDHMRALDLALAAVASEPLDEELHMLVARIHLAQGNSSEALRQFDLCASVFRRELGIEPTSRFSELLPVSHALPRQGRVAAAAPPGRAFVSRRSRQ